MNHLPLPAYLLLTLACASGPSDNENPSNTTVDGGGQPLDGDGSVIPASDAAPGAPDAGSNIVCVEPTNLSRGHAWVRDNPLFVSGLTVNMPEPTAAQKSTYYDEFGASAAHLWLDGLPAKSLAWSNAGAKRFLSWTKNDGTGLNGQMIGGIPANSPGRIGFQIGDEPRDMAAMLELKDGFDNVRATDPDALLVLNFSFSADDIEAYLNYYGTQIDGDIVSYDLYSRSNRMLDSMASVRQAGLTHNMPYWTWLRSYRGPGENNSSASDMRWNVYSHVLYGYTGFSWFFYLIGDANGDAAIEGGSLFATDGSYGAGKTSQYAAAAELNAELVNIGPVITQLTSTAIRYISSISFLQPDGTQAWSPGAGGDQFLTKIVPQSANSDLMVGFFEDHCDQVYFMVQNQNHSEGNFPTGGTSSQTIHLEFDFSGAPDSLDTSVLQALDKSTGDIISLPLTAGSGQKASISLSLEAGDAILLKYKTGGPFASQGN